MFWYFSWNFDGWFGRRWNFGDARLQYSCWWCLGYWLKRIVPSFYISFFDLPSFESLVVIITYVRDIILSLKYACQWFFIVPHRDLTHFTNFPLNYGIVLILNLEWICITKVTIQVGTGRFVIGLINITLFASWVSPGGIALESTGSGPFFLTLRWSLGID